MGLCLAGRATQGMANIMEEKRRRSKWKKHQNDLTTEQALPEVVKERQQDSTTGQALSDAR